MTKIIGNLAVSNGEFIELCYELEIDKERLEYMKQLAEKVKELNVYEVTDFDYRLDGYQHTLDDEDMSQSEAEAELVGREEQRLDCVLLHVSQDGFRYTGYLKHTDLYFATCKFTFHEVENNEFLFNPC
jgi:hypothetical protein